MEWGPRRRKEWRPAKGRTVGGECYLLSGKLLFFVFFLTALLLEMTAEVRFKTKTGTREKRESMNKCRG